MHNGSTPLEGAIIQVGKSTQLEPKAHSDKPFERIRHLDEDGEYWLARELMVDMEYTGDWRNFARAITKAQIACAKGEFPAQDHFVEADAKVSLGSGATRSIPDFRLTRHACYLVAQNADPRKEAVAKAMNYFAVQVHKQELAEQERKAAAIAAPPALVMPNLQDLTPEALTLLGQLGQALTATTQELISQKALMASQARALEMAEFKAEVAQSKAEYVDEFVDPGRANTLFRTFCGQINAPERKLRDHLAAKKVIYKKVVGQQWSKSRKRWEDVLEWHAHAPYKTWFHQADQPDAPRMRNDQMRTTLYVTPIGKVSIARWLHRNPIDGVA